MSPRNSGQRVKLEEYENVTRRNTKRSKNCSSVFSSAASGMLLMSARLMHSAHLT